MSWAVIGIGHPPRLDADEGLVHCGLCWSCAEDAKAVARSTGSSVAEHRVEREEHHWARVMRCYGVMDS